MEEEMADQGIKGSLADEPNRPAAASSTREGWGKAIPQSRDRWQSDLLVWGMGILLSMMLGLRIMVLVGISWPPAWFFWSCAVSVAFAAIVWKVRGSTPQGAVLGGAICLKMMLRMMGPWHWQQTALPELVAVFVLTYAATRFGRRRKERMGTAETRKGRRAAQVAANLGVAGYYASSLEPVLFAAAIAALAEAAADTVSSEMGQALGGRTEMITSGERVAAGTDGAVSLRGTACGIGAAGFIAGLAVSLHAIDGRSGIVAFAAGCVGLFFDSVLGATVERKGWIGNDWVNLISTWVAAWLALHLLGMIEPPLAYW
jgi:uncharacterized protein (TIGR00297 family)